MKPPIITRLQELPDDIAHEVNWYLQDSLFAALRLALSNSALALALQEGMGRQFIWHGLARWHAYAVA